MNARSASPARRRGIIVVVLAMAALAAAACGLVSRPQSLDQQRTDHLRLQAEFNDLAGKDPVVAEALAQGGDVTVGIRPALVQSVLADVAARYLDQVDLDLALEKQVSDSHELTIGTFLGKVTAGTWNLDVTLHRVQGRLHARTPRITAGPDNKLLLDLPVQLEEGHGTATVHFAWKSHSVASVVCHDFELTRNLSGRVLAHEYVISGALQLIAGPESLRAEPLFPPREFRLQTDMTEASWAEVRSAIHDQDQVLKCGLALDPEKLLAKLRDRLHEGFDVKLPRSLFRPVDFPAAIRQEATFEDRQVALDVKTHGLAITPMAAWYSADVSTRIEAASPSPAPSASPSK